MVSIGFYYWPNLHFSINDETMLGCSAALYMCVVRVSVYLCVCVCVYVCVCVCVCVNSVNTHAHACVKSVFLLL